MVTRQERPPSHREKFSSFHVSFYVWRAFVNDVVVFVVVVELDSLYTYIPSPLCVLLAEGQSVCLWVWLSWCEASFAAAIEWRDLTPKWLLMDDWTQLTSRLGLSTSIRRVQIKQLFDVVTIVDLSQSSCSISGNWDGVIHKFGSHNRRRDARCRWESV